MPIRATKFSTAESVGGIFVENNKRNKKIKAIHNTCAAYHCFFRTLVFFDSAFSLKGAPLHATHFKVFV